MIQTLSDQSDAELVSFALAGRQDACRELLARHREPVFRLVRASMGDPHEAIDITQDTFIAAFSALGSYDRKRPFKAWIKRIALNKCRDWARRRKVRAFFFGAREIGAAFNISVDAVSADTQIEDRAELGRVMSAMARLPTRLREALVLRAVDGLNQAEAAAVLGVNEKTVETRLYRARLKLMEMLDG